MRGKKVNERKRNEAVVRQDARDDRTDEQQLARLNKRPGNSMKERAKLA